MNWMALLAALLGLAAILASYVAVIFRDRVRLVESLSSEQGKLIQEQRRYIGYLKQLIGEHLEAADAMNDCNVELERRNVWLEQRRHVILRRWWRRAETTHRRLASWQVRRK